MRKTGIYIRVSTLPVLDYSGLQCMTRSHRGWLGLQCKTLSFSTPCRFIPALSVLSVSLKKTEFIRGVGPLEYLAIKIWLKGVTQEFGEL